MKKLFKLFWTFFKMGLVNFGGGYAMLPLLQKEIVDDNHWCTEDEMNDYFAVGQCTPGLISINVSTFIGYKLKKIPGAIATTLGFVLPSFIIILIIAMILQNFSDIKQVKDAFAAIRVCVCVLMIQAVLKMFKKSIVDIFTLIIFIAVFFASIFLNISPIYYVVAAGVIGLLINVIKSKKMNNRKGDTLE